MTIGFLLFPCLVASQTSGPERPPPLAVPTTSAAIRIDGRLEEEPWKEALVIDLPYEIDPGENTPAKVRTEFLLLTDGRSLLVAVRASDPEPDKIRANFMDRDKPFDDDWVMVSLDPFLDRRRGFQFLVTPLGVQMDTLLTEVGHGGSEVDPAWDAIWSSAGEISEDGFVVEMAIPFTSLRFPRLQRGREWGFQAIRHYPRLFSYFFRATPWNRDRDCVLCENLIISGLSNATPGRNLEVNPAVTALRTDERVPFPLGAVRGGKINPDFGLSTRWGVTPNVSLNAALNPDFSQVEADVAQLEINTRFALFYPEKRPFFLEAADLFRSPLQVIYTRTLADPEWGVKLTGKEQTHAFAVLTGRDSLTNVVLPSNQASEFASLDQPALSTALRYRREVGTRSSLGALVTDRRGPRYRNSVYGLDGQLQLSPKDRVLFQLLGSQTAYPDELLAQGGTRTGPFNGSAWSVFYGHEARNWHWWTKAESLSRSFRADVGFIPRVDIRTAELGLRRVLWPGKESWYSRINLSLEGGYAEDQGGQVTDKLAELRAEIHGPLRTTLDLGIAYHKELFKRLIFDQEYLDLMLNMQPRRDLSLLFSGKWGDAVDYEGSRPARVLRANPAIIYFPTRHLQLQVDQLWERLGVEGRRLYMAGLTQLHLIYMFNTQVFLRAILQYQDVDRNPALTVPTADPLTRHLFTQFLFSYKINPQTLVFLGYSDSSFAEAESSLRQKNRTFFLKLSYAWVR
jgi:hypothetical protein